MPIYQLLLTYILLHLFCKPIAAQASDNPQSIASLQAYKELRACAQNCFEYGNDGCVGDNIANHLVCPYGCFAFALDSCYCRPDLQTAAESWISSCISTGCVCGQTTVDISSAVSIYDGYCLNAGYTALRNPKVVPTATTTPAAAASTITAVSVSTASNTSPPVTTIVTILSPSKSSLTSTPNTSASSSTSPNPTTSSSDSSPTLTAASTSSDSKNAQGGAGVGGGGIGLGDRIALGVGIPTTIFAFLALFATGKFWRRRRARVVNNQ